MKVLITGATGTIGKALVNLFENKGYQVIATSRNSNPSMDIENPDTINRFFGNIGFVDAIVCAAGDASFGAFTKMTAKEFSVGIKSKLMGQINLCKAGLNFLNPKGTIILTGGIFAHQPWPNTTNIAMANAALEGFIRALSLELENDQRILIVHPPLIRETAETMGMDGSQCPTAAQMAEVYLSGMQSNDTGKALFF